MVDLTRVKDNNEKKTVSVVSAIVEHSEVPDTANVVLFNLPGRCLVTRAYIATEVPGQASLTVDIGFAGGAELINDGDLDGTPPTVDDAMTVPVMTGTGKQVTAKFSADPTAGRWAFIVEYIEYTLGNGKLLNYSA